MNKQTQILILATAYTILALTAFGYQVGIIASAVIYSFIIVATCNVMFDESARATFLQTVKTHNIVFCKNDVLLAGASIISVLFSGSLILLFLFMVVLLLVGFYLHPLIKQNSKK